MIHILWATLRPATFKLMHNEWLNRSDNKDNIKTHVAVNWDNHADELKTYLNHTDRLEVLNTSKIGVCFPAYALSSTLQADKDDIVIFASDDFMAPNGWDTYLIDKLKGKEGNLFVRDGYQLPDSTNMLYPAITIPIMTYGCLEKMNKVIYHPAYAHMFSDCELYMTLKDLGLLIDDRVNDTTTFEHHHYAAGKRNPDQNDQMYHMKWKDDEQTWNKRKIMSVQDRLIV